MTAAATRRVICPLASHLLLSTSILLSRQMHYEEPIDQDDFGAHTSTYGGAQTIRPADILQKYERTRYSVQSLDHWFDISFFALGIVQIILFFY